jgi:hypothetical protein
MRQDLTAPVSQTIAGEQNAAEQSTGTAISPVTSLAEVLNSTLRDIECREALRADDPALVGLRHSVLRIIAELEVLRSEAKATKQEEPA